MVFFTIIKWILIGFAGLFVLLVGLALYEAFWQPRYDDANPRYQWLVSQLDETRQLLADGRNLEQGIDLSGLNDGNWTTACIFGGYNNPLEKMVKLGAKVADEDRERLSELTERGFRLAQVEEFEVMVAFIDLTGSAQFIHLKHGIGPEGQHMERCIRKPRTVVNLLRD